MLDRIRPTRATLVAALLWAGGCEFSVGDGDFDGGFPFDGDAEVSDTGGSATGGSATGGSATGGQATGGNTGGTATGGTATGGTATGGTATGGTATGGTATGGTATGGTMPAPTAIEDVPAALAAALCAARESCIGEVRLLSLFDGNACTTIVAAELSDGAMSQVPSAISAGLLTYDATKLDTCLADVEALGCDVLQKRLPASCDAALAGTVAQDRACNTSFDCAGDAFCDYGDGTPSCPGVCTSRGAGGAGCSDNEQCRDGLFCTPSGTCQQPQGADEPCDLAAQRCGLEYACIGLTANTSGRCQAITSIYAGADGDACTPTTGTLCSEGLVCSRSSKTCVAKATAGAACSPGSLPDACPIEQFCEADSSTCADRGAAGAVCTGNADKECAAGLVCIGESCTKLSRIGEACDDDGACFSGSCNLVSGECQALIVCI